MAEQQATYKDDETYTMAEWEQKIGYMFIDYVPNKKVTWAEIKEMISDSNQVVGVVRDQREQWLKANGYEANRANMMDGSLSTRQPDDEQ